MVEGKKWGECTKCLRWYHTDKCLNISQKSLEGEWVCLNVYLRNISSISVSCTLFLSMNLYVCHLYVIHALLAHLHSLFSCTITVPLSHYYCHALLNMSPYCYLIHGAKYFRGGLNISYSVMKYSVGGGTKYFVQGDKIGGTKFFMTGGQCLFHVSCLHARTQCCCCIHFCT